MPHPSLPGSVPGRKVGERFNPWREACGFFPPDIIARQRDLGDGPKRLYERLVRWAGQNAACWYSYEKMADALGKCVRQVKSDLVALERYGLVQHQRRGKRMANRYTFLWHPVFGDAKVLCRTSEVQSGAHQFSEEVQLPADDVQSVAPGDVQPTAPEFRNWNCEKRIASSSPAVQAEMESATKATDDSPLKEMPQTAVRRHLTQFVQDVGIEMPAGQMPVDQIASGLVRIGADEADLIEFLKGYRERWTEAPSTWRHVAVSFRHWSSDPKTHKTLRRRLGWRQAEARHAVCRQPHEQQQADTEGPDPRKEPTSYPAALVLAGQPPVPWPLQARLERTGDLISPAELTRQVASWRVCRSCRDSGALGNAIDKTLRFCGCVAGQERCHRDGASWPEQEIARVHASAQSLLTAACYDLRMNFAGDAVAEADLRDDGSVLEIVPAPLHAKIKAISENQARRALARVGWVRTPKIVLEPGLPEMPVAQTGISRRRATR